MKTTVLIAAILFTSFYQKVHAHCEIPCGIYEDSLRIELLYEHILTIEKSMNKITEISESDNIDYNQLVRWINNKEDHANKIQDIVSQYFLHQRIKITDPENEAEYQKYFKQLESLHHLLVYAMKAKQTTDLQYIEKLRKEVETFAGLYFHTH